jgi:hypothetical protein
VALALCLAVVGVANLPGSKAPPTDGSNDNKPKSETPRNEKPAIALPSDAIKNSDKTLALAYDSKRRALVLFETEHTDPKEIKTFDFGHKPSYKFSPGGRYFAVLREKTVDVALYDDRGDEVFAFDAGEENVAEDGFVRARKRRIASFDFDGTEDARDLGIMLKTPRGAVIPWALKDGKWEKWEEIPAPKLPKDDDDDGPPRNNDLPPPKKLEDLDERCEPPQKKNAEECD